MQYLQVVQLAQINKGYYGERITRVETTLDKHSTQINKLFSRIEDTNEAIQKINNSMLQIKWSVYGAIGFYIVTQIGIIEALRLAV